MSSILLVALAFAPMWVGSGEASAAVHVDNPAKAPRAEVVRMEELWRAGEDDADVVFGVVGSMVVDGDGRVYVVDTQAGEVSVLSADGKFLRHLGRKGEAPGEFQAPYSLVVMPDGNVGIINEEPPRIICYRASDGAFVKDFHFTADPGHPFERLENVTCRGKSLVVEAANISQTSEALSIQARLMRFDGAGKFLGECDTLGFDFTFAHPVVGERWDLKWAVGPDGKVYVNDDRRYDIAVHGSDCGVERTITRDYEPIKRTSAERDSISAFYRKVGSPEVKLFHDTRDIVGLWVDDAGRLWVLPSRGRLDLPADSLGVFDVYDAQGKLDRTVDLRGTPGEHASYTMTHDRFFELHKDTMALVAYRMPKLKP